ncbi:hypothetical protein PQX77_018728 [Marasmius sp. AFHP31]|nr:hypothetical protein PQX77_018728 [Marasmius sp. AFHP31]
MASEEDIAHQVMEPYVSIGPVIVFPIATMLVMSLAYGKDSTSVTALGFTTISAGIAGCIFDYLMVHRCYVIWGYNKWILYPFAFVVVITDMFGLVAFAFNTATYQHHYIALYTSSIRTMNRNAIISAVYSSLLTLLTAGRIWWTVYQVGQIAGSRVYTKYRIIVVTILESGFLVSAMLAISVVLPLVTDPGRNGLVPFDFTVISTQMIGIAPTVMIVRIAYGQAVESVQQMVSTLQIAEGINNSHLQSAAVHGMANPQQSLVAVEERGTVGRIETD